MPSLAGVRQEAGKDIGGFKKFILRGNVVDLAVGIVIGAAFSGVVQALVRDIITPLIGAFGGNPDFSSWVVTVAGARPLIGDFLNALLAFLLLALVVYFFVVVPYTKAKERFFPSAEPDGTPEDIVLLTEIRDALRSGTPGSTPDRTV